MKVINSRQRVLLEVTDAYIGTDGEVLYDYTGPGKGGSNHEKGLMFLIDCIRKDAPSAHIVGELPAPTRRLVPNSEGGWRFVAI